MTLRSKGPPRSRGCIACGRRCHRHFQRVGLPARELDTFEIDVLHPGAFLLDLLDLSPRLVIEDLEPQAAANRREPRAIAALLDTVARAGAPGFADEVRRLIA